MIGVRTGAKQLACGDELGEKNLIAIADKTRLTKGQKSGRGRNKWKTREEVEESREEVYGI